MIINAPSLGYAADPDINSNSPVIGYHNLVATSNLASTTANSSYPLSNLANNSTVLLWKGTALATESITFTYDGSTLIDYVGIVKHNFHTIGSTVTVEVATDGVPTYSTVITAQAPLDDGPLILRFVPGLYTRVRVSISAGSAVPQAAVMYVGLLLALQRRVYVGHSPITLSRSTRIVPGKSEAGDFLGRIQIGEGAETGVSLKNLTPSWYRTYFDPFVLTARTEPFFFAWRPMSYPRETSYAWLTQDPKPSNALSNGMMQVDLSMSGVIA